MEVFYYRCEQCGFLHQVPAYWMGYEPEETVEQMHFSPADRQLCPNQVMTFDSKGDSEG